MKKLTTYTDKQIDKELKGWYNLYLIPYEDKDEDEDEPLCFEEWEESDNGVIVTEIEEGVFTIKLDDEDDEYEESEE